MTIGMGTMKDLSYCSRDEVIGMEFCLTYVSSGRRRWYGRSRSYLSVAPLIRQALDLH